MNRKSHKEKKQKNTVILETGPFDIMDSAVIISNVSKAQLNLLNLCCRNIQFQELLRLYISSLSYFIKVNDVIFAGFFRRNVKIKAKTTKTNNIEKR